MRKFNDLHQTIFPLLLRDLNSKIFSPQKNKTAKQFYVQNKQFSILDLQSPMHVDGLKIQTSGCVYCFPGSGTNLHNRLQPIDCNFSGFFCKKFHRKRSMKFKMIVSDRIKDCTLIQSSIPAAQDLRSGLTSTEHPESSIRFPKSSIQHNNRPPSTDNGHLIGLSFRSGPMGARVKVELQERSAAYQRGSSRHAIACSSPASR
jgi:hypothetical protein